MSETSLGLRTVIYKVGNLESAKKWYTAAFGVPPYFDEPFYVGFNIGGYELGLDPDVSEGVAGKCGSLAYWGVNNLDSALSHFLAQGAKLKTPAQDVGGGIRVASVSDPFGNVIGLIENPNFQLPAK